MKRLNQAIDTATRLIQLAVRIDRGEPITTAVIRAQYGVSHSTAKRDMVALEFALDLRTDKVAWPYRRNKVIVKEWGAS